MRSSQTFLSLILNLYEMPGLVLSQGSDLLGLMLLIQLLIQSFLLTSARLSQSVSYSDVALPLADLALIKTP